MDLPCRNLTYRRITRSVLPLVAVALLLVNLPLLGGLRPAGATGGADVALFFDSAYVDTAAGGGGEAYNMRATLQAQGHTVTTFTGTSSAAWSAALTGQDLVVVPELQNGDLNAALHADAKAALRNFVQGGGGFISTMDGGAAGTRMVNLLNIVYGYSLTFGSRSDANATLNTTAAAGTPYAGGPATIPYKSAVGAVVSSSLPSNAKNIYVSDSGTRVWVTFFAEGAGQIALLGWDWYQAAPTGAQDGGWLSVLSRSIDQVASPGLEATLSASSMAAGSPGSATVSVTNNGDADATSVELTGSVPATLAITGVSSSQGTCTAAQAYSCSVGTLTPGQTVTATVSFSVAPSTAASSVNHSVHVTSTEGATADAQGTATITESNSLALAAGAASVAAGAAGQLTVAVTNNGPSNADTTTVTGTVPAAASVTGVSSPQGTCSGTQSYSCAVGTLAPGQQATITVSFAVAPSGPAQTVQHSTHATSAEGATADAAGSIVISEQNDLTVASGGASVVAGRTGTFSVEVSNNGPSDADATTVEGTVPAAAAVTGVSSSQGTCSGTQSYTCSVGALAPGADATVTVRFSVSPSVRAQTLSHSARATSAAGASDTAAGAVIVQVRNELSLTATGASVTAGKSGLITFTVTNHGPSDADATTLTGTLPDGLAVIGVAAATGSCRTGQSYSCAVGTLPPGDSTTVSVQFSVSPTAVAGTLSPAAHATSAEGTATAQTAVTVSEPAPPGGTYGSNPGGQNSSSTTISPGGEVTVSGTGFRPGSDVEVWMHSTPVLLGVARADDAGAFTATYQIPTAAEAGSHHIVLEGTAVNGTESSVTLNLAVLATLPVTGGANLLRIGVLVTLAGTLLLQARRRTKAA